MGAWWAGGREKPGYFSSSQPWVVSPTAAIFTVSPSLTTQAHCGSSFYLVTPVLPGSQEHLLLLSFQPRSGAYPLAISNL